MNRVSIIGFGRFGAMLHSLLSKGFEVDVFDKNSIDNSDVNEVSLEDALQNETIFIAVPIRDFENLVKDISKKISSGKTVIDVCSVKVFPKKVMLDNLSNETDIIATHPLFGPDSLKDSGSVMTMESVRNTFGRYDFWKNYFESQNILIEEITAEEHDMMAARSQGLTHFVGRVIDDFGTNQTRIDPRFLVKDTTGQCKERINRDSWLTIPGLSTVPPRHFCNLIPVESIGYTCRI